MIKIGLVGLGAIGRVHFDCWRASEVAQLVAVSARDPKKLAGDWSGADFNLGGQPARQVDFTGIATYARAADLIADPAVELVDICTPTPLHAPLAIAALRAGKHVLCEKPMALDLAECHAMEQAAHDSGRRLMIGHCLRYWPQYAKAKELIESGEFGRAIYASFSRTGAAPLWSAGGWLLRGAESGGVLDMHIHDIDAALWWFGEPQSLSASGFAADGLPMIIDAIWKYDGGLTAHLHSAWDRNGGDFHHAFRLVLEKATLVYDLSRNPDSLLVIRDGNETALPMPAAAAHQNELDDFAARIAANQPPRIAPAESRRAVEIALEELRQLTVRSQILS